MAVQSDRPLIKVRAASERTGVDERTLRRAAAAGEIPSKRVRRRLYLFPDWVDDFLTVPDGGDAA